MTGSHPFTVVMGPEEAFINQYERMVDMTGFDVHTMTSSYHILSMSQILSTQVSSSDPASGYFGSPTSIS